MGLSGGHRGRRRDPEEKVLSVPMLLSQPGTRLVGGVFFWKEDRRNYPQRTKMNLSLGFGSHELENFRRELDRLEFRKGEELIREGEKNRDLYILTRGSVSVKINLPASNRKKRLFTFSAGVVFGEMALLDGNPRLAEVVAECSETLPTLHFISCFCVRPLFAQVPPTGLSNLLADICAVVPQPLPGPRV